MTETRPFEASRYIRDMADAVAYLRDAATGDDAHMAGAIRDVLAALQGWQGTSPAHAREA